MIDLIDVSKWQGPSGTKPAIDWDRVRAAGVLGVQIRTNLGLFKDPNAVRNLIEASMVGFVHGIGVYYAHRLSDDPLAQAELLISVVKESGVDLSLVPWQDCEIVGPFTKQENACRYELAARRLDRHFIGEWPRESRTAIYTRMELWRRLAWPFAPWAGDRPLIVARYEKPLPWGNPGDAAYVGPTDWETWASHQYSERGQVDGITGFVDVHRVKDWDALTL